MESVQTLIDEALKLCATKRELAERLGMTEQNLQGVQKERRHLTTRQAVALAKLLDRDPKEVLAQCAIGREDDSRERARLRAAFFPIGRLGMAACVIAATCAAGVPTRADALPSLAELSVYTLCAVVGALLCSASPRLRRRAVWDWRPRDDTRTVRVLPSLG